MGVIFLGNISAYHISQVISLWLTLHDLSGVLTNSAQKYELELELEFFD